MSPTAQDDKNIRRKYPRRAMRKKVGVLFAGEYFICESGEIGEGGMSILSDFAFTEGRLLVLSFQMPRGGFVTIRATVKSVAMEDGRAVHGLSFTEIPFTFKRQIRAFVSTRIQQTTKAALV